MKYLLAAIAAGLAVSAGSAEAAVIYEHFGANDPATEGWSSFAVPPTITVGPVLNDLGSGINAWTVDDNNVMGDFFFGPSRVYSGTLTSTQSMSALHGWTLSTNLRVVDVPDGYDEGSVFVSCIVDARYTSGPNLVQGLRQFVMTFGTEADGDPIVSLDGLTTPNGVRYVVEGGAGAYHLYELRYEAVDEFTPTTVDVFVDGVERISDFVTSFFAPEPGVGWGTIGRNNTLIDGTDATGQGNYNLVRFEIVPEPSAAILLMIGVTALALARGPQRNFFSRP